MAHKNDTQKYKITNRITQIMTITHTIIHKYKNDAQAFLYAMIQNNTNDESQNDTHKMIHKTDKQ